MRHILGILVATTTLLLAAGCGHTRETATDQPADTSADEVVAILSGTAAAGTTSGEVVDLDTTTGIEQLVGELRRGRLANQVRARVAATDVPDGQRLVGAIVNIGCDTPVDVKVVGAANGVRLEPVFQGKPMPECLAAVTTIALVLVQA
jgi:hypothetical protein